MDCDGLTHDGGDTTHDKVVQSVTMVTVVTMILVTVALSKTSSHRHARRHAQNTLGRF
jgi:hypothetical protein